MGVSRSYEVYCDVCGDPFDGGDQSLATVRKWARKQGWMTGPKGDFCPNHRPDKGRKIREGKA